MSLHVSFDCPGKQFSVQVYPAHNISSGTPNNHDIHVVHGLSRADVNKFNKFISDTPVGLYIRNSMDTLTFCAMTPTGINILWNKKCSSKIVRTLHCPTACPQYILTMSSLPPVAREITQHHSPTAMVGTEKDLLKILNILFAKH